MTIISALSAAFLFSFQGDPARAQMQAGESLSFQISMLQQSCRRASAGEDFLCSSEPVTNARTEVFLSSVSTTPGLEDQAWEGSSADLGMTLPGGSGQYLPKVSVRKSTAAGQAVYTLRFKTFQFVGVVKPTVFETVYVSTASPVEPVLLMGERLVAGENKFNQILFILTPGKSN